MYFLNYICLYFILFFFSQLIFNFNSFLNVVILSELIIVLVFCMFLFIGLVYNLSLCVGFGLACVMLSSLEAALAILLLSA